MESFKCFLLLLLGLFLANAINSQETKPIHQTDCSEFGELGVSCIGDTPMTNLPLTQGRCCLNSEKTQCSYQEAKVVMNIEKLRGTGMTCGTNVEKCIERTKVPSKAYQYCYTLYTEIPFKCCYVRVGARSFCYPLDVTNTDIYSIMEHKLRAKENSDDPFVEIFCKGVFTNSKSLLFIFSFFFLLF